MTDTNAGKHFTAADDILLLKEADFHEPWAAPKVMAEWDKIAARLRKCSSFPQDKDGKAVSTRFSLLIKKYHQSALSSMRKSGREEDFLEREQLLDDIAAKLRDHEAVKAEEKAAKKRKRDAAGAVVLRAAVGEHEDAYSESASDAASESDTTPRKTQILEAFLEKMLQKVAEESDDGAREERKLQLLERQLDQQQQQLNLQREQFQQQVRVQEEQMRLQQEQTQAFLGLITKMMEK